MIVAVDRGEHDGEPGIRALKAPYRGWVTALGANPEMPLDELRLMFEHWAMSRRSPAGSSVGQNLAAEQPLHN